MYMFTLFILGMWVRVLKKCCTDGMFQGKFHFAGQKKALSHFILFYPNFSSPVHTHAPTLSPPQLSCMACNVLTEPSHWQEEEEEAAAEEEEEIIIKLFLKCKILSLDYSTHTHTEALAHTSFLTIQS